MITSKSARLHDHFAQLRDPRKRKVTYPLINIVAISVCAVICGADDFVAIAEFGRRRRDWLATILDLSEGIPSHDRFNAVLAAINPAEFEKCLLGSIMALHEVSEGQIVATDGKTLRRSCDAANSKAAIHMVSALATANHITLGQVAVDAKSNEITAIPKLLEILEITGSLVTIDAMECQVEIAREIVERKADYCLAVKDNQPTLRGGMERFFEDHLEDDFARTNVRRYETEEKGHWPPLRRSRTGPLAFSGRCEYHTWESVRGDLYVVSLALKNRSGKAMPSYEWWKILARVVASRAPNDAAALDIGCSELASVESMRSNCLPCGAVEFLDGRPCAMLDQVDSWFTCECSAIVAANSEQAN